MPVGAKFPSLRQRVTVRFGEPLDLSHHGPASSGRARRLATDDIMAAIHALSGQELANAYNEVPAATPIDRIRQVLPHERR
jgi:1-acyl-sn-glycerol-3-phosphate acyltransferase